MSFLLEPNDWQLGCFDSKSNCIYQQAAAAAVDGNRLLFGDAALAQSRTTPQSFNAQYLSRLDTEPLPQPIGAARNNADLLYHQLQELRQAHDVTEVAVATPAHYSDEQLGLLLGIASEAGITIKGFIDSALAHATQSNSRYQLFDISLNQAHLTDIEARDGELRVIGSTVLERLGIINIIDAWLQVIANSFMQTSRFDPLHSAESEQQVFDQALGLINRSLPNDLNISVTQDGTNRRADLSATQLSEAIRQRLPASDLKDVGPLVLTPRASSISGLRSLLEDITENVSTAQVRSRCCCSCSNSKTLRNQPVSQSIEALQIRHAAHPIIELTQQTKTQGHKTILPQHICWQIIRPSPSPQGPCKTTLTRMDCYDQALM